MGRGIAKGCNIVRLGAAAARTSIHEAIWEAFRDAGLDAETAQGACIGVAGSAVPEVREAILGIAREVLSCPVAVVGDQEIAHEAAFGDTPGIVVISGTGSIAFGRNAGRRTARAGGHGLILSDEGSGHWIGRTAVSDCLRSMDSGRKSELFSLLLHAFHVSSAGQLIQAANAVPLANFSGLLPLLLTAADAGDAVAMDVFRKAGSELANLAGSVSTKLGMAESGFSVAMVGGVFEHSALVRESFHLSLKRAHPHASVIPTFADPQLGALALAAKERRNARQQQ